MPLDHKTAAPLNVTEQTRNAKEYRGYDNENHKFNHSDPFGSFTSS